MGAVTDKTNFVFTSQNEGDTIILGRCLGSLLTPGCVVGLTGELGAGKTYFVKGIAYGINKIAANEVTSPTFTILQEYEGRIPLYHFDAYRLSGPDDLEAIGFYEYVYGKGVSIIEWADRIGSAFPDQYLLINIEATDIYERVFTFQAYGLEYMEIIRNLKKVLQPDKDST